MFLVFLGGILFTRQNQLSELICTGKSHWFFWYNYTGEVILVIWSRHAAVRKEWFSFSQFGLYGF